MDAWTLGLSLGIVAVGALLFWLRRRSQASYSRTVIEVPPTPRPSSTEVDLLLDFPPVLPDQPAARLGYRDSTLPTVQDPPTMTKPR